MLKNILKLDGAQKLSKDEQKALIGGGGNCENNPNPCLGTCNGFCISTPIWNEAEACFDIIWSCIPLSGGGGHK